MIQQAPIPPTGPPFDPNLIWMNEGGPPAIVMIVVCSLIAATIILWPIMRALARRLEGRGAPDPALRAEMEQVHQRLAEIDSLQVRLAELEERLDFTERLLAQAHPARLGAPTEESGR
jgi:Tfp pilus assembly protein PilO